MHRMTHMLPLFPFLIWCLLCVIAASSTLPYCEQGVGAVEIDCNEDNTELIIRNDYSKTMLCANRTDEVNMHVSSMCTREGGCPHSAMVWASGTFTLANLLSPMTFANASEISLTLQLSLCCNYLFNGNLLTLESSSETLYVEFVQTLLHSSPFAKLSMEEQLQLFPRDMAVLYNSRQNKTFRLSNYLQELNKSKYEEEEEEYQIYQRQQKIKEKATTSQTEKEEESKKEGISKLVNTVDKIEKNDVMDGDVLILQTGTLRKDSIALLQKYLLETERTNYMQGLPLHLLYSEEKMKDMENNVDSSMWHGMSNVLLPVSSSLRANSLQLHITNKVLKCKCPHTLLVQPLLFMKPDKLVDVVSINGVGSHCAPFTIHNVSSSSNNCNHNNIIVDNSNNDDDDDDDDGSLKDNECGRTNSICPNCSDNLNQSSNHVKLDHSESASSITYKHYCYTTTATAYDSSDNSNSNSINMLIACRAQFTLNPPLVVGTHVAWIVSETDTQLHEINHNISSNTHSVSVQIQKTTADNVINHINGSKESKLLHQGVIFHEEILPLCRARGSVWQNRDTTRVAKSLFFSVLPNKEYNITAIVTRGVRDYGNILYDHEFTGANYGNKHKEIVDAHNKINVDNNATMYTIQRRATGKFILRLPFKELLMWNMMQQRPQGAHNSALLQLPQLVPAQPHFGLSRRMSLSNSSLELICSTFMSQLHNTQTHLRKDKLRGNVASNDTMSTNYQNKINNDEASMDSYNVRKALLEELVENYEMYWEIQQTASLKEQTQIFINRSSFAKTCLGLPSISEKNVSIIDNNTDVLENNNSSPESLLSLPPGKNIISFFVQDVDHACDRVEVERHEVWALQSVITTPATSPITVCENNTPMALLSLSHTLIDMRAETGLAIYLLDNAIVPVKQENDNRTEGKLYCTKLLLNDSNHVSMKKQDDVSYKSQECEVSFNTVPSFSREKIMSTTENINVNVSLIDKGVYQVQYVVSFMVSDRNILHKNNFDEKYAKMFCKDNDNNNNNNIINDSNENSDIVNKMQIHSTHESCIVEVYSPRVLLVRRLSAYPRIVKIQLPMHATQWTLLPPSPHLPLRSSSSSSYEEEHEERYENNTSVNVTPKRRHVKEINETNTQFARLTSTNQTPIRGRWIAGNVNMIRIASVDENLHVTLDTRRVPNMVQQLPYHTLQLFIYDDVGEDLQNEYDIDYVARCPEPFVVEYEMNVIALPVIPFEPDHEIMYTEKACLRLPLPLNSTPRKGDHVHWRAIDCSMNNVNVTPILLSDEGSTRKLKINQHAHSSSQGITHYKQAKHDEAHSIMACAIVPYSHCVVQISMFNSISSTVFNYHLRRCQLPPNLLFANSLPLLSTTIDAEEKEEKQSKEKITSEEQSHYFTSLPTDVIYPVSCIASTNGTIIHDNMHIDNDSDDNHADTEMECAIYNSHEEQVIIPITTSSSTPLEEEEELLSILKLYYEYNTTSAHNVHLHVLHTDFVPLLHLASSQLAHTQAFVDNAQSEKELLLTVTPTNHNTPYKANDIFANSSENDIQLSSTCISTNDKDNNYSNKSIGSQTNNTFCNRNEKVIHITFTHHVMNRSIEFSQLGSSVLIPVDYSVYSASPHHNSRTILPGQVYHSSHAEYDNKSLHEWNADTNTLTIANVSNTTHHLKNVNQSDSSHYYHNEYHHNYDILKNDLSNSDNEEEIEFAIRGLCRRYHGLVSLFHLQPRGVLNVDTRYNLTLLGTSHTEPFYGVIPVCSNSYHFARHPSLYAKYGFSFQWSCDDNSDDKYGKDNNTIHHNNVAHAGKDGGSRPEINVQTISPTESRLTFDALHTRSRSITTKTNRAKHSKMDNPLFGAYCRLTVSNHFTHTNASERIFLHRVFPTSSERAIVILSNNTVTEHHADSNNEYSSITSSHVSGERHDTIKADSELLRGDKNRHTKPVDKNTPQIIRVIGKSVILHVDDVFMSLEEEQPEFNYAQRTNNKNNTTHGWKVESIVTNKQVNVGTQYLIDQVHITPLYQHPTSLHRARVRVYDALIHKDGTTLRSTSYFINSELNKKYMYLQSKHAKVHQTVNECEDGNDDCATNNDNNFFIEDVDDEEVIQEMVESIERRGSTVLISNLHTPGLYTISFIANDPIYPNECAKMHLTITLEVFHALLLTSPTVVICGNEATLHALPLPLRYQRLLPTTAPVSSTVKNLLPRAQQQTSFHRDAHMSNEKAGTIYTKWEVISVQDAPHHIMNVSSNSHNGVHDHESDVGIEFSNATNSPSTVISHLPFGVITVQWSIYKQIRKHNMHRNININKWTHASSVEQDAQHESMYEDMLLDSARTRLLVLVDSIDIERIVTLNSYINLPITSSTVNWTFAELQETQELEQPQKEKYSLRSKEKESNTTNSTLLPRQIRQEFFNQGQKYSQEHEVNKEYVEHHLLQTSLTGAEIHIERYQNAEEEKHEYEEYEQSKDNSAKQATSHSSHDTNNDDGNNKDGKNRIVNDDGSGVLTLTSLPIGITTLRYNLVPSQNVFGEMVEYSKRANCSLTSYLHIERIAAFVSASVANVSHECDLYSGAAEITLCVHAEQLSAQQNNRSVEHGEHKTIKHNILNSYSSSSDSEKNRKQKLTNSSNQFDKQDNRHSVKETYTSQVKLIPLTEIERVMKYDAKRLLHSEVHTPHNFNPSLNDITDTQILPWWIRESSTWENIHYVHTNLEEESKTKKTMKETRKNLHKSVLSTKNELSSSSNLLPLLSQQCIRFNVFSNVHLSHNDVEANMFALNPTSSLQKTQREHRRGSAFTTTTRTRTASTTLAPHMFITSRIIEGSEIAYDIHQGTRHRSVIQMPESKVSKNRTDYAMFGSWRKLFSFTQHEASESNNNKTDKLGKNKSYLSSSPYHRDKLQYLPLLDEHTWQPLQYHLRALKPNDKHTTLESISELVFSGDVAQSLVESNSTSYAEEHETMLHESESTQESSYYSFELEESSNTTWQNASTHRNKITLLLDWSTAGFVFAPVNQRTNSGNNSDDENSTIIRQESLLDKCVNGNLKGKDIFQQEWIDEHLDKQALHSQLFATSATSSPSKKQTHLEQIEQEQMEEWRRYVDGIADAPVNCTLLFRSLSKVISSDGTLTTATGKATLDKLKEQMRQSGLRRTSNNINALLYFRPEPSATLSNHTPSAITEHTEEEEEKVQHAETENDHHRYERHNVKNKEVSEKVNVTGKQVENNVQDKENVAQKEQYDKDPLREYGYITANVLRQQLDSLERHLRYTMDGIEVSGLRTSLQRALSTRRITRSQLDEVIAFRRAQQANAAQIQEQNIPRQISYANPEEHTNYLQSTQNDDNKSNLVDKKADLESLLQRYEAALRSLHKLTQQNIASSLHSTTTSSSSSTIPRLPSSLTEGTTQFISNVVNNANNHYNRKNNKYDSSSYEKLLLQQERESDKWQNEVFALQIEIPSFQEIAIRHDMHVHKRVTKNSICGNSRVKTHNANSFVDFGPLQITDVPPQFTLTPLKVKQCEVEGAMPPITISVMGDRFSTEQMHSSHWFSVMRQISLHEVIAIDHHTIMNNNTKIIGSSNKRVVGIRNNLSSSNNVLWQYVRHNDTTSSNKTQHDVGLAPCIDLFKEQLQVVMNTNTTKQLTILLGNCPFLQMLAPEEYNNPTSLSLSSSSSSSLLESTSEQEIMQRLRTPRFLQITLPGHALQNSKHQLQEKEGGQHHEEFAFVIQVNPTLARLYLPTSVIDDNSNKRRQNNNANEANYNFYRRSNFEEYIQSTNVFYGNYKRPLLICERKLKKDGMMLGVELVGDTWTHHVGVKSNVKLQKETDEENLNDRKNNDEHNVHQRSNNRQKSKSYNEETGHHNWSYESAQNIALLNSFSAATRPAHSLVTNIPMLSKLIKQEEHKSQQHKLVSMKIKHNDDSNVYSDNNNEAKSDFIDYLYNLLFTRLYHQTEYEYESVYEHKNERSNNVLYEEPHNELIHKYNDTFISIFFPPITSTYTSTIFTGTGNVNTKVNNHAFVNTMVYKDINAFPFLPSIRPFHRVEEIVFAIPGIATECQGCLLADSNLYVAGDLTGIWLLQEEEEQESSTNNKNGISENINSYSNNNKKGDSGTKKWTTTCMEPNCALSVSLESLLKPEQHWNLHWLCVDAAVDELHSLTNTMSRSLSAQYTTNNDQRKSKEQEICDNDETTTTTCNMCNKDNINISTLEADNPNTLSLYMSLVLYHVTDSGKDNAATKATPTLLNKNMRTWKTSKEQLKPRKSETVYKITLLQSEPVNVTKWLQTWELCLTNMKEKYEKNSSNDYSDNKDYNNDDEDAFDANSACNIVQFTVQQPSTINNDALNVLRKHWPTKKRELDAYVELHLCARSLHSSPTSTSSAAHTTEWTDKLTSKECMLVSETSIKLHKTSEAKRSFSKQWLKIRSLLPELKHFAQMPNYNERHIWRSSLYHMYITTPLHLLHALLFFIVLPFIIPRTCLPSSFRSNSNLFNNNSNSNNNADSNTQSLHYSQEFDSIRNFATSWFLFALYLTSLYYPWLYFVICGLLWTVYLYLSERLQAYLLFILTAIYWYYTH